MKAYRYRAASAFAAGLIAACTSNAPEASDAMGGGSGTGNQSGAGASGGGSGGSAGSTSVPGAGGLINAAGSAGEGNDAGSAGTDDPGGLAAFELVVIGSSTAAGEGASDPSSGWVALLEAALKQTVASSFSSSNLAVGGYATQNLMPDSGSAGNIEDAIALEPNLILVALAGSNDLSAGVSSNTFMSRLTTIRDSAVTAGIPVFFLSTAPKDLSTTEREALRDWAAAMAETFGSCWVPGGASSYAPCFVDIFGVLANSSLGIDAEYGAGDGIHLNDSGHAAIFDAVEAVVLPYVCSMTECS